MSTAGELFKKNIKTIIDTFGQLGVLHNTLSEAYDTVSGDTVRTEQTCNVMYTIQEQVSLKDFSLKEKFIQRDDFLAKFEEASVSFYTTDPLVTVNVNENSYIVGNGKILWLKNLQTIEVGNEVMAFIASIKEER